MRSRGDRSFVLAVDLGTGGPKVAVVSDSGEIVSHASSAVELELIEGGGAQQDPRGWWEGICSSARRAIAESGVTAEQVVGVGCTAQWSGTVATDREGEPLRPAIIWMDCRGAAAVTRQTRGTLNVMGYGIAKLARWVRLTGGAPGHSGKDPVAHILWIRENEPDVYAATFKFLEPVDWLNQRLCGRFCASFDSIALHWVTDNRRIGRIDFDERLLRISGLERPKLPELVPTGSVIGTLSTLAATSLGVPAGIPVVSGSGDVHSAAVGSGAVADYDAHLYIGTSSWISCHVPFKKTDVIRNVASIPSALAGRYLVADEHETAGACLDFLVNGVLVAGDEGSERSTARPSSEVFRRLDAVAAKVSPGAHRTIFTPWLNGERSPVDDHTIRGGFHNLSLGTTQEDLVRAVYEGVAFNSRWLLGAVEHFVRKQFSSLSFIGGGANSDVWAQIHADVTRRAIRQVAEPVLANVRGAGLLTLLALGRIQEEQIPGMIGLRRTFEPDPDVGAVYDDLYREFVNLYKRTKAIHRRLNAAGGR